MARLPRLTIPGLPYHVTQRGNRRQPIFFRPADRQASLDLLRQQALRYDLEIWAYCLMDNHVHLVVMPRSAQSLTRAVGETHRRYTRHVNFREGWRGYLFQGRFGSVAMDEEHVIAAVRYVERNPVIAGMVARAEEYPWSSARAHVTGSADALLTSHFLKERITDWAGFLRDPRDDQVDKRLNRHGSVGRPLGSDAFLQELEQRAGRRLRRGRPGRRPIGK